MTKSWQEAENRADVDKLQGLGLGMGMMMTILGAIGTAGTFYGTSDTDCKPVPTEISTEFEKAVICEADDVPLSPEQKTAMVFSLVFLTSGVAGMAAGASSVYTQRKLETPKP